MNFPENSGTWDVICNPTELCPLGDTDGDYVCDIDDNCPTTLNPNQVDSDADGTGNLCDNCPDQWQRNQADSDADGIGDWCDNCNLKCNIEQLDADDDGEGDVCDDTPGCAGCGQSDCEQECISGCDTVDRYLDNEDGTITDCRTGLAWMKDPWICWGTEPVSWQNAGFVSWITGTAGDCGLSDNSVQGEWRLPTKNEWMLLGSSSLSEWHEGDFNYPWSNYTWDEPNIPVDILYWYSYHVGGSDGYNSFYYGPISLFDPLIDAYYGTYETLRDQLVWPVRDAN
jgi:hypothetical protein